jgi:fatty acid desaturase
MRCLGRVDVEASIIPCTRDTRHVSRRAKIIWVLACLAVVGGAFVLHGAAFFAFALLLVLLWVGTALVHAYRRRRHPEPPPSPRGDGD